MIKKIIIPALVIIVLLILNKQFFFHKWLGYESIPNTYIFDEHNYPFVGYSLRKTGVPIGWSNMDVYKILDDQIENPQNTGFDGLNITVNGNKPSLKNKDIFNYPLTTITDIDIGKGTDTITLIQPFFDHPIFGSWLYSLGTEKASSFNDFKPSDYRKVSLYLSIITGIMIFIFSYLLFSNLFISFLSFFIYSTVPEFILMSRYSLFENILVPLSLIVFSLILLSQKNRNILFQKILILFSGIFSGLAFITKESSIFIIISSIIFFILKKEKINKIIIYLSPIILFSFIYYSYMYYLSPELFFKLLFDQANRQWFGPLSFFYQIVQPNFSGFPKSGFWLFGLISLFIIYIKNNKKYLNLFIPFIVYLFVFLFMGGLNYPWYYLPFLPFIVISSSVMIHKIFLKPNLANLSIFYLLIFSSSFYWGYFVFHQNQNNYLIFRLSLLVFSIFFVLKKLRITKYSNFLWYIFFLAVLFQIYQWNNQGFLYIISNWSHLPTNFSFPF